jgi:hypothetical protein
VQRGVHVARAFRFLFVVAFDDIVAAMPIAPLARILLLSR